MRSKAHFNGHPLHPALVHFPLAFLIGAFGFDLYGMLAPNPLIWRFGEYLAAIGVLSALAAAIPGFLDYFLTVPPNSSGKRRATQHMLLNLGAVTLFAAGWLIRDRVNWTPSTTPLLLEAVGTVCLFIAGYLGGVLVSRNQIGVDHRYAGAGKWDDARAETAEGTAVIAAKAADLALDQMKLLHAAGRRIVLARTEEGLTAFDDRCPHRGGSLADGVLISGTVQCPWHGSQFDAHTGAVCGGPARKPIQCYRVEQRDQNIVIYLEGGGKPRRSAREPAAR
ncbi:MAG TPA: DUF2231 domain-containing protein [Gemmatimonadales bacterium]|nr:DUF2231 domain-containing protein [Gemmatimonadales bacterium]